MHHHKQTHFEIGLMFHHLRNVPDSMNGSFFSVQYKRGKKHGTSTSALCSENKVEWESGGLVLVSNLVRKKGTSSQFEKKELVLTVHEKSRTTTLVGKVSLWLDHYAQHVEPGATKTFKLEESVGKASMKLSFSIIMGNGVKSGSIVFPAKVILTTGSRSASPLPAIERSLVEGEGSENDTDDAPSFSITPIKALADSPSVQSAASPFEKMSRQYKARPASVQLSKSGGLDLGDLRMSLTEPSGEQPSMYASSSGIPLYKPRASYSAAAGIPEVRNKSPRTSEVVPDWSPVEAGGKKSIPVLRKMGKDRSRPSLVPVAEEGGAAPPPRPSSAARRGHRRAKSHAVTPSDLKELNSTNYAMQRKKMLFRNRRLSRASEHTPHSGSMGTGLPTISPRASRGSRRGSVSSVDSASLRLSGGSSPRGEKNKFLIEVDAPPATPDGDDGPDRPPPRRSGGPKSPQSQELTFYKQQLAAENLLRDRRFVANTFILFAQPEVQAGLPLSSYVLYCCLRQWDCLEEEEEHAFTQLVVEDLRKALEQQCKQEQALYWASMCLGLIALLCADGHGDEQEQGRFLGVLRNMASEFFCKARDLSMGVVRAALAVDLLLVDGIHGEGSGEALMQALKRCARVVQECQAVALPQVVVEQLFCQMMRGVVASMTNGLLSSERLCTFSNGLQLKRMVTELCDWLKEERLGEAVREFAPLMQLSNVLSMNKEALLSEEVRQEVCPDIARAQLVQLLTMYAPDEFDSEPLPPHIVAQLGEGVPTPLDYRMDVDVVGSLAVDLDVLQEQYSLGPTPSLPRSVLDKSSLNFLYERASRRGSLKPLDEDVGEEAEEWS